MSQIAMKAEFICQQGQVNHVDGPVQLEFGFGAASIPGLANPQLNSRARRCSASTSETLLSVGGR